jgi:hypothetical protein
MLILNQALRLSLLLSLNHQVSRSLWMSMTILIRMYWCKQLNLVVPRKGSLRTEKVRPVIVDSVYTLSRVM